MSPTPPRGSPASRTSPSPGSNSAAATTGPPAAPGTAPLPAPPPTPGTKPPTRNHGPRRCPRYGAHAGRYATATRTLHDLGDPRAGRPIDLLVTFSRHHCPDCDFFFPAELSDLAWPRCLYSR